MLLMPAVLTSREAADAARMLAQAIAKEAGPDVVVDASALRQLDTAALAVLLDVRRRAADAGKAFVLRDAPPKLGALAKLYGVDEVFAAPTVSR
jgi:phospholipid transport system transporter-binding protein